jgi:hypothetical protein
MENKPRESHRSPLQIDLSEVLVKADTREHLRCLGVDVSRAGLGIVGFASLTESEKVLLVVNGKGIPLEVVWVKIDPVRPKVIHAGLKTKDVTHDLERELAKAGLLRKVESWQFPKIGSRKK